MDPERTIEFEFVRATENAALNSVPWLGRGEKELADGAACDAIYGVFDLVDICGEVVIGEGQKDNAPGIFLGDHSGLNELRTQFQRGTGLPDSRHARLACSRSLMSASGD